MIFVDNLLLFLRGDEISMEFLFKCFDQFAKDSNWGHFLEAQK